MKKVMGWIGYQIRELANEIRCWSLDHPSKECWKIIDWLDKKECVRYWRKKDRGV